MPAKTKYIKHIKVKQIDGAWCKVSPQDRRHFEDVLSYNYTWYKKTKYKNEPRHETGFMIDRRRNEFLLGLLPIIKQHLRKKNIGIKVTKSELAKSVETFKPTAKPFLNGITFRPDQIELIEKAIRRKRGIIKSPTGSGKTIIAMGISSMFPPEAKILFLVHTKDLLSQTVDEFRSHGFKNVQMIGGGGDKAINPDTRIVVATNLKYVRLVKADRDLDTYFSLVIVDEAHHASDIKNSYGTILMLNWAPYKIGFTATPHSKQNDAYKQLSSAALIGPVIGELTIEEGIELGIIARPKLTLLPVPHERHIGDLYSYKDIYPAGITNNKTRNKLIISTIAKRNRNSKSVLIMVKEIQQGENLVDIAENMGVPVTFLQGSTSAIVRNKVKRLFSEKMIGAVITTVIWKEGINIPSLDCVINACGGRGEIQTLQFTGRGLRRTDLKHTVEVVDFLDPYKFLAQHTVMRLQTYARNGWL
ncbi:MAG: hypothetical protein DRJ03_01125 [Chloroflexi bacterium]|nr:MAG: hypothetical protein DRJ03_01125 [Chloroflexota bacterium]